MPKLLQKVQGEIIENINGELLYLSNVSAVAKDGDYIELNGLIVYLQNMTKVSEATELVKPLNFGLPNTYNINTVTLEIDY